MTKSNQKHSIRIIKCKTCNSSLSIPKGKHITFNCPKCQTSYEVDDKKPLDLEEVYVIDDEPNWIDNIQMVLALLVTIPLFIILHKEIPNVDWIFNLDRILLAIGTFMVVFILFDSMRYLSIIGTFIAIALLSYGTITNKYGFIHVFDDYRNILTSLNNSDKPIDHLLAQVNAKNDNSDKQTNALVYDEREVKRFINESISKQYSVEKKANPNFEKIINYCAVFNSLADKWHMVESGKTDVNQIHAEDYIDSLKGNALEYAVFVASCVESIGGKARITQTINGYYPEINFGKESSLLGIQYILKQVLYSKEIGTQDITYHVDKAKDLWIHFGHKIPFPGAAYPVADIKQIIRL